MYIISVIPLSSMSSTIYLSPRHNDRTWTHWPRIVHAPRNFRSLQFVTGKIQVLNHLHYLPFFLYVFSIRILNTNIFCRKQLWPGVQYTYFMDTVRYRTSKFQIGQTSITSTPVFLPNRIRKCSFVKMTFFPKNYIRLF